MIKKLFILSLWLVYAVFTPSQARIVETQCVSDILTEIDKDTLVLFDVDETTLYPMTTLGSRAWWVHFESKFSAAGIQEHIANPYLSPLIIKVNKEIPNATVEPVTSAIVSSLQKRGITVLALTARHKTAPWDTNYGEFTRDQLLALGIDFTRSDMPREITSHSDKFSTHYAHGILFSNWELKGPVLRDFLKTIGYTPTKVVMIDDSYHHLHSVEDALKQLEIPFVGFHYTRLAHQDQSFDPMIGNIQLHSLAHHGIVLTDAEAQKVKEEMLSRNPAHSPDFYLETLTNELKVHH